MFSWMSSPKHLLRPALCHPRDHSKMCCRRTFPFQRTPNTTIASPCWHDPGRTRTCNPRLRRPRPYPVGHGADPFGGASSNMKAWRGEGESERAARDREEREQSSERERRRGERGERREVGAKKRGEGGEEGGSIERGEETLALPHPHCHPHNQHSLGRLGCLPTSNYQCGCRTDEFEVISTHGLVAMTSA